MARLTEQGALAIAHEYGIPLDSDYHALNSATVEKVIEAANARGYRKPKNANGSRARYFHAYLRRAAGL